MNVDATPTTVTTVSETRRTIRNLLLALFTLGTLGVIAASVVTLRTAGQPITVQPNLAWPGSVELNCQLDDQTQCGRTRPVSPDFPEADAVFVMTEDDAGYNGYAISSFPKMSYLSEFSAFEVRNISITPSISMFQLDGSPVQVNAGLPTVEYTMNKSDFVDFGSEIWGGWIFGDITSRDELMKGLADGPKYVSLKVTISPEDGASREVSLNYPEHKMIVTLDTETEVIDEDAASAPLVPIDAADPPRQLGLGAIWGTTLGLLALIGIVGMIVARPLVAVANRSERRRDEADLRRAEATEQRQLAENQRSRAEASTRQLEHVLSATHHELSRELIMVGFIADDLTDDGVDTAELNDALQRLAEGRDSVAALAQLGTGNSASLARQVVRASDLTIEQNSDVSVQISGDGTLVNVDRLLVRSLIKSIARWCEHRPGVASLGVLVGDNQLTFSDDSVGTDIAVGAESWNSDTPTDQVSLAHQIIAAHGAEAAIDLSTSASGLRIDVRFPPADLPIDLRDPAPSRPSDEVPARTPST